MHVCKATIWDYKIDDLGILEFFPEFWEIFFQKMTRFFEQNFNFSLFYQNLIKINFFQNSKRTWFWKVWTNRKWPNVKTFEYLLAVNPCGLQAKNSNFHRPTVKSRNGQIWKFLFEGFDLVHSSSLNHIWRFWDLNPGQKVLAKFRFSPFSRPIYKNKYAQNCPRPMGSV